MGGSQRYSVTTSRVATLGVAPSWAESKLNEVFNKSINGFTKDIAPGVEDPPFKGSRQPIGITQHNIIRFRIQPIESIRPFQIDVQSLTDQSFAIFSELLKKIRRPQRVER